jgi:hypothetical protein
LLLPATPTGLHLRLRPDCRPARAITADKYFGRPQGERLKISQNRHIKRLAVLIPIVPAVEMVQ